MSSNKNVYLIICFAFLLTTCSLFDAEEAESYVSYVVNVGGNGYDLSTDVIETEDAYVLVGALGPQCDIVDAFMAKIDKESGSTISIKTFGNPNQGTEENFFSLLQTQNGFKAVGFSKKPAPPEPGEFTCGRDSTDRDINIFYGTLDKNFDNPTSNYFGSGENLDNAFHIGETQDREVLITGSWDRKVGVLLLEADTISRVIRSENYYGDGTMLLFHSSGRIFLLGKYQTAEAGWGNYNTYLAEVDLQNERLINERVFTFINRGGWISSLATTIVETTDGQILLAGYHTNATSDDLSFLIKTDLNGNELFYNTISMGINDSVNDMIVVEDGYVISGRIVIPNTKTNAFIAQIDELGNIQWQAIHGSESTDDWAEAVIQTSDGGFLMTGRTINRPDGIQTILVIKTDAEGQVEQ